MRGMQDIRSSNKAGPHRNPKTYTRKAKHANRQEW